MVKPCVIRHSIIRDIGGGHASNRGTPPHRLWATGVDDVDEEVGVSMGEVVTTIDTPVSREIERMYLLARLHCLLTSGIPMKYQNTAHNHAASNA